MPNNIPILHVRREERRSIAVGRNHEDNDFDHDLVSGAFPEGQEEHGIRGTPRYVSGTGFDRAEKTGMFQLTPDSRGAGKVVIIPNFCEETGGNRPDVGAHQRGTGRMRFGVKAAPVPPRASRSSHGDRQ